MWVEVMHLKRFGWEGKWEDEEGETKDEELKQDTK